MFKSIQLKCDQIRNDKMSCLLGLMFESCINVAYMYVGVVNNDNKCVVYKYILIMNFTIRYMQKEKSRVHEMFTRNLVPNNCYAALFFFCQICGTYYGIFNNMLMMCICTWY